MALPVILRPDAKGRIGLRSLTEQLELQFNGRSISGYSASLTEDGKIILQPRIGVDVEAAATLILSDEDRDAFLNTLENPPSPNEKLKAALMHHRSQIVSGGDEPR